MVRASGIDDSKNGEDGRRRGESSVSSVNFIKTTRGSEERVELTGRRTGTRHLIASQQAAANAFNSLPTGRASNGNLYGKVMVSIEIRSVGGHQVGTNC